MSCNLYTILEVDETSSLDDIKTAYKRLALKYHPDKNNGDSSRFVEILNAYEILSDNVKKDIYDKNKNKAEYHNLNASSIKEVINNVAKTMYNFMQDHLIPQPIWIDIPVTVADIYYGRRKRFGVKVKRWIESEFTTGREVISIDASKCLNRYTEFVFSERGDCSLIRMMSNSDIIVTAEQKMIEEVCISKEFGISVMLDVTLEEFNNYSEFDVPSLCLKIPNFKLSRYVLKGYGLLTGNENERGEMLVILKVV